MTTAKATPRRTSIRDAKLLWGLAAGRCAFPDCRVLCVEEATEADPLAVLGENAHIAGHSPTGPRHDPGMTLQEVDAYANLVLLCTRHHTIVDKQKNTYTVEDLRRWKDELEAWVRESLAQEMPNVGFAELDVIANGMIAGSMAPSPDFSLLPPRAKMERNGLTARVQFHITIGLSKAKEVEAYVQNVAIVDPGFPERLKGRFLDEYQVHSALGMRGDELFEEMLKFAARGHREFLQQAAGLAVLVYLFEKCEIFQR